VNIAPVSARLGHASINNTTIKYYVHPLQKNMKKAAYVLQDLLINDNNN
jgi:integrase